MKLNELTGYLEKIAPLSLQESYDNAGLLVGSPEQEVSKALICLDVTMGVLEEALEGGFDLIISHHPLIFGGIKRLCGRNETEKIIIAAIKNGIAIYAMHTNLDNVETGVNAMLCEKLGIRNARILQAMSGKLNKLVTFCPADHAHRLREALFTAGAGHIGNYDSCSFNMEGYGTFRAGEDAVPYVGEKGKSHTEKETRIELIFPAYLQQDLIQALTNNHPYEEVAYDIYPLGNDFQQAGSGMIGTLEEAVDEQTFMGYLKEVLGAGVIRHSALTGRKVSKVAVCGGAGSFLIGKAIAAGADVFITGDVKYHQFFEAEGRMIIADAGHFETEQFTKELISRILNEKFPTFAHRISQCNTNAVHYL
jgi:dinuclear metal center YbgI/SA1388 family protein